MAASLNTAYQSSLVIVSDDAGQFNVLLHALCWIHANRVIDKIIAFTDQAQKDLETVKDQVWQLYEGLKAYKQNPKSKDKKRLNDKFDDIFMQTTSSAVLNLVLKRIYNNKSELLLSPKANWMTASCCCDSIYYHH